MSGNFISIFKKGQEGLNQGISTGIPPLDIAINGIQRNSLYTIGAAPKVGKTTLTDFAFLLNPFLNSLHDSSMNIEWLYFSYEIDRIRKEFKLAPYFFKKFYNIDSFEYKGSTYRISSNYLLGRLTHDGEMIKLLPEHLDILKEIYELYIIPLFGEYDSKTGKCIKKGKVSFYDNRENPTGINKILLDYARKNGTFHYETFKNKLGQEKKIINGYEPNDPNKYTIVILDHIRKLKPEKGYNEKQTIDKMLEYQVDLRNHCGFTFVDIIHLNRSIGDVDRIKFFKDNLYPTGDDLKGSGNASEESDYIITMFNPKDEKYNLKNHFGIDITKIKNYRSIHLVESRDTECPVHLPCVLDAESNMFYGIKNK